MPSADALLRRAGEVFGSLVEKPASASRIGGDEFAVLLPATDLAGGEAVLATLAGLIELNNQYYPEFELTISTGIATSRPGDRLEQVVKRADMKMLHAKRLYYLQANRDRRGTGAA
jgi:diguanylate cyclase (GGDEF)-like protein